MSSTIVDVCDVIPDEFFENGIYSTKKFHDFLCIFRIKAFAVIDDTVPKIPEFIRELYVGFMKSEFPKIRNFRFMRVQSCGLEAVCKHLRTGQLHYCVVCVFDEIIGVMIRYAEFDRYFLKEMPSSVSLLGKIRRP